MAFNDVIVKQVRYECIYLFFFFGRVAKGITRMLTGLKGMSGDDFVMENFSRAAPTKKRENFLKKKFRPFLITGWKTSLLLPSREETSGKKRDRKSARADHAGAARAEAPQRWRKCKINKFDSNLPHG